MSDEHIFILTGAGVSAESGLSTFRDKGGVWKRYNLEDVATPQGFRRNPQIVHDFYNGRRSELATVSPNPAHIALGRLEKAIMARGGRVSLVTQNVDDLHERGGSTGVVHMHGELLSGLCEVCELRFRWSEPMGPASVCPCCSAAGHVRPDIVWFGEVPYHMDDIFERLSTATLFVSIGTSGSVYPAAGFVEIAHRLDIMTVEINLEPSENADMFDAGRYGAASVEVPSWVDGIIASGGS